VFKVAVATIEHVSLTTTDGAVRGTAAGLLLSVNNFKFLLSLTLLTPLFESVNNVSEYLQSPTVDILCSQQQVGALKKELLRLRGDDVWSEAVRSAELKARTLGHRGLSAS
jgi:hypothetical protein